MLGVLAEHGVQSASRGLRLVQVLVEQLRQAQVRSEGDLVGGRSAERSLEPLRGVSELPITQVELREFQQRRHVVGLLFFDPRERRERRRNVALSIRVKTGHGDPVTGAGVRVFAPLGRRRQARNEPVDFAALVEQCDELGRRRELRRIDVERSLERVRGSDLVSAGLPLLGGLREEARCPLRIERDARLALRRLFEQHRIAHCLGDAAHAARGRDVFRISRQCRAIPLQGAHRVLWLEELCQTRVVRCREPPWAERSELGVELGQRLHVSERQSAELGYLQSPHVPGAARQDGAAFVQGRAARHVVQANQLAESAHLRARVRKVGRLGAEHATQ